MVLAVVENYKPSRSYVCNGLGDLENVKGFHMLHIYIYIYITVLVVPKASAILRPYVYNGLGP